MNQIKKTIWLMLTHSIVNIILVVFLIVFFLFFQFVISANQNPTFKSMIGALIISWTLSVFLGVYFGGALQKIKQNYLWSINKIYRHTLINSFLIVSLGFSLLVVPLLYINLNHIPLIYTLPFCVTVFSSYLVLGKNLIYKIAIPAIPFIIIQFYRWSFSYNSILVLIVLATVFLVIYMYMNRPNEFNVGVKTDSQKMMDSISFTSTGLNSKFITKFDSLIGRLLANQIQKKKRDIDWAIITPHTKLALFSLLYVFLIVFSVLFISNDGGKLIEAFIILFLSTSLISIQMESRLLLRQLRPFAHVFNGANHRQLRNKILRSLDRNFIINSLVFIISIIIFAKLFSIPLNVFNTLVYSMAIMMTAIAYYPLLLCFQWINISLYLVIAVSIYASLVYISIRWIRFGLDTPYLIYYLLVLLGVAAALRFIMQMIFFNKPFEILLKNK